MPVALPSLDSPVSRHVHQKFAQVRADQTVTEALETLRRNPPEGPIIYFYVVDDGAQLQGVVPTRRLLLSPGETPLTEIMIRQVITLPATATVLDACEFFIQHRLLAFPVVDSNKRLIGVVDVGLYTDEITRLGEATEGDDLFQRIGVRLAAARDTSPFSAFGRRFPWLGCNLSAGIIAALLVGAYEPLFKQAVALAFFIPVVLNLAESVSSQSVSLALQRLHGRRPRWENVFPQVRSEAMTGILLGLASGAVMAVVGWLWLGEGTVALCLVGGILGGVTGAAVLGTVVPTLLRLLRLEPRVAAGPIVLAGADIITLLVYLGLAQQLVG